MAKIIDVKETGFGRRRVRISDHYTQEYTRVFRLYTDAATDTLGEQDLIDAKDVGIGLPQRWDAHPEDDNALVTDITATETEYPQQWLAEVSYSSDATDESRLAHDPLEEPPTVSWTTETYKEAIEQDAFGTAILNTAGDPIEGIEVERYRLVATYEDNVAEFDEADALNYQGTCNSQTFRGKDAYTWLIRTFITTGRGFKNNVAYWRRRIEFVYDPSTTEDANGNTIVIGHQLRILNAGYRQLVSGALRTITDGPGRPVSQPVPLAQDGSQLPSNGTPVYLTFKPHLTVDFNVIPGLNNNW